MRKAYVKPMVEIETYELSTSIAANCGSVVSLGPEAPGVVTCDEFKKGYDEILSLRPGYSVMNTGGKPFYSDGKADCDCYYSSGGNIYFTS